MTHHLETLHGIIHRDLNPNNFFIQKTAAKPIVKIGDYGLAKCYKLAGLSGHTISGRGAAGTYNFMSRRQLLDYKYAKPEVDVWAVAASLYYLISGQFTRNFSSSDPRSTIVNEPVIPIRDRQVRLPTTLAQVIDRALDESNGSQPLAYSSAAEFRQAIHDSMKSS